MDLPELHIDLETRSAVNLKKRGVYVYAEDPSTDVLCACWALGEAEPSAWLPSEGGCPDEIATHVAMGGRFVAHNKDFERTLWHNVLAPRFGWPEPEIEQWDCTMARAALMALPQSLGECAWVVGVEEQKDDFGYQLMMRMCQPRRVDGPQHKHYAELKRRCSDPGYLNRYTLLEDGRVATWDWSPQALDRLVQYCKQDVRTERAIEKRLRPMSEFERKIFAIDARINDRGILADFHAIDNAHSAVTKIKERLKDDMFASTGGYATPTEIRGICEWLLDEKGIFTASLNKESIQRLLDDPDTDPDAKQVLEIRRMASKSSTSKLVSFKEHACRDQRCRGNFRYSGAHTHRWSGMGVQFQNMMRPTGQVDIPRAIEGIMAGWDPEDFELMLGTPVMQTIAECMRGMVIAAPGQELCTGDFSNIEGRVNAWLAGEKRKIEVFEAYDRGEGPDPYLVAAAGIYHRPVDAFTKESPERQIGKVAELSMGYQGGIGAFRNMAKNYGVVVSKKEANDIKKGWRGAHPLIVKSWRDMDDAARSAVMYPGEIFRCCDDKLAFVVHKNFLWMRLPSGSFLGYCRPHFKEARLIADVEDPDTGEIVEKEIVNTTVHFWGRDSKTKKWSRHHAYGGFWCENAVQSISRDILCEALVRVEDAGYPVVLHAHDELVAEVPREFGDRSTDKKGKLHDYTFEKLMEVRPSWASDCPIVVEGWRGTRYRK